MTIHQVAKPVYRALQLLNKLANGRVYRSDAQPQVDNVDVWGTRDISTQSDAKHAVFITNFNVRKSFVYYDPYEPNDAVTYSYLKFEDQEKLRASVVLDFYKKEIESLEDDSLSFAGKERKQQVIKLIDYLGQLKVVDASVLLKLHELYRYKL